MTPAPASALIVKPGSMGDVIHALPVAAALKAAWPHCRITWLIDSRWEPLLEGNPNVESRVVFPRKQFRGVVGVLRAIPWVVRLRHIRPELCLDLQGLLRSGLFARMACSKKILGLSDAREGARLLAHEEVQVDSREHSVRRYLRVCDSLGIPQPEEPEFWLPASSPHPETPPSPYVVLHPFSRGASKSLSAAMIECLCAELAPLRVVLLGGAPADFTAPPGSCDLLGKTDLHQLVGIIRRAAFVVSVDSGPAHIAAAVKTPLIVLHSWSDPARVGPFSTQAVIWKNGLLFPQTFQPSETGPRSTSLAAGAEDMKAIASRVKNSLARHGLRPDETCI